MTSGVPTAASLAVARTLTNAQTTLSAVAAAVSYIHMHVHFMIVLHVCRLLNSILQELT